ncbi:protein Red [Ditylenchus destructor]|uniref:Protein Red n=1 Tax=Ditylenchus destructor TaxID=166010 RepID=A0AAD4RB46_9BILA|nr:protein Red [Ditylenchus destructor]
MMTETKNLRNEDFRKLLATPASASQTSTKKHKKWKPKEKPQPKENSEEDNVFKESQAKLNEILQKYRDRAAERRKGVSNPEEDAELRARLTAAYRAVPATAKAAASLAERRRMEIEESKYLGGDMEHTHLVKGLDYSLLNKVRNEIESFQEGDELEQAFEQEKKIVQQPPDHVSTNKMVKNMCKALFKNELPTRNEMFAKGRMAYVVELDDEDIDVPSTLLRSVADSKVEQSANESINADNVVINKLTQVLSYLRTDLKKRKRGDEKIAGDGRNKVFDDVDDDYAPSRREGNQSQSDYSKEKAASYFDGDSRDKERVRRDRERNYRDERERDYRDKERDYRDERERDDSAPKRKPEDRNARREVEETTEEQKPKKRRLDDEDDAYSELYPSGIGLLDAIGGESDEDEPDFSKMDMGNKKGPVKRWDFDTDEQYQQYQQSREAMPKAAYQYGVKMSSGRKTRKNTSAAGEKKIDRELDKINKILDDRKKQGYDSGSRTKF